MRRKEEKETEKSGIVKYIREKGKFSFSEMPFCPADSLIFTVLSYLSPEKVIPAPEGLFRGRPGEITLQELAELYEACYTPPVRSGRFSMEARAPELLPYLAVSERFSGIRIADYESFLDEDRESQFAAATFLLPDTEPAADGAETETETAAGPSAGGVIYITYRGTDDHMIGWKEDFNMSYRDSVPSQERALAYLNRQSAKKRAEKIFLGGHSKGGNLAAYAAVCTRRDVRKKIAAVHCFDSPGFGESFFSRPGYPDAAGKITHFMPEESMVGRLFEHREKIMIVKSGAGGLLQHIPFYWSIEDGDFVPAQSFGKSSGMFAEIMKNWINGPDDAEKKRFIDTLFGLLEDAGISTTDEMHPDPVRIRKLFGSIGSMPEKERRNFFLWIRRLLKETGETMRRDLFSSGGKEKEDLSSAEKKFYREKRTGKE